MITKKLNVAAITGHRSSKLPNESIQFIETQVRHALKDFNVDRLLQGMCDGVDLIAARESYRAHVPYEAVRPWAGHTVDKDWLGMYDRALTFADGVTVLNPSEHYPGPSVFHERNRWMVDRANFVIAVWDGHKRGGTFATVTYAQKKGRPVWHIDIRNMDSKWL